MMKCPDCGQYSLTYDWARNGWWCHVYNGFIPDEDINRPSPKVQLDLFMWKLWQRLTEVGVFG